MWVSVFEKIRGKIRFWPSLASPQRRAARLTTDDFLTAIHVNQRAWHVVEHQTELLVYIRRVLIDHVHIGQRGAPSSAPDPIRSCPRWTFRHSPFRHTFRQSTLEGLRCVGYPPITWEKFVTAAEIEKGLRSQALESACGERKPHFRGATF